MAAKKTKKPDPPILILNPKETVTLKDVMDSTMFYREVGAGKTKPDSKKKPHSAKTKKK